MADVCHVQLNSPMKTCLLDPFCTDSLLESFGIVLPFILAMCNASLREGRVPSSQKKAIVKAILKKPYLNRDEGL
jgi:hypothetical protein